MGNKLGITEGEWFIIKRNSTLFEIRNNNRKLTCELENYERNKQIMSIYELESNAKLIADAGTTANKCGKLPSQILQENEEMKAMLDICKNEFEQAKDAIWELMEYQDGWEANKERIEEKIEKIEQLLTKINQ